jgi:hypothetical protein
MASVLHVDFGHRTGSRRPSLDVDHWALIHFTILHVAFRKISENTSVATLILGLQCHIFC